MGCNASIWWSTVPVGSAQARESCTWFKTEKISPKISDNSLSVFELLWEMQIKHYLFILVEGRAQTANLK